MMLIVFPLAFFVRAYHQSGHCVISLGYYWKKITQILCYFDLFHDMVVYREERIKTCHFFHFIVRMRLASDGFLNEVSHQQQRCHDMSYGAGIYTVYRLQISNRRLGHFMMVAYFVFEIQPHHFRIQQFERHTSCFQLHYLV